MHNNSLDWNETAVRQAMDECDNVPYLMIGSLGLGAVALAFTNYFVAGALTLGGVALSQKKQNNAIARAEFAIKHNGSAVAARGNELKEYAESFGTNAAAEQLLHAAQRGIPLNRDGWNLLEDCYGDKLDDLLEQSETQAVGHRWFQPEWVPTNSDTSTPQPASIATQPPPNEPTPIAGLMHFFRLQNTLVWGGQGSGKTSFARAIAADKLANNQKIIVLNPHGSAGTWQGMRLIGAGKDYKAVEAFMRTYLALVKKRYQLFEQSGISEDDFLEQLLKAGLVVCQERIDG
ncbi:ATP-binding protein [Leptolyngbyaceae cyanobacterium UHCC 1019]